MTNMATTEHDVVCAIQRGLKTSPGTAAFLKLLLEHRYVDNALMLKSGVARSDTHARNVAHYARRALDVYNIDLNNGRIKGYWIEPEDLVAVRKLIAPYLPR